MEPIDIYISGPRRSAMVFKNGAPEIAEPLVIPETKPAPTIPRPDKDDPFNVPAPKIDPTPKGFSFFSFL